MTATIKVLSWTKLNEYMKFSLWLSWVVSSSLVVLAIISCTHREEFNFIQEGIASYYHPSLTGNQTANGEQYHPDSLAAAHMSLPFKTQVLVENKANNKSIWVTINDRGPYVKGRIIDLSHRAADSLGLVDAGIGRVVIKAQLSAKQLQTMYRRMN